MMKTITIKYHCRHVECDAEFDVDMTPGDLGCTYGPPENCYPPEPDEISPEECPECGEMVDYEIACEQAGEEYIDEGLAYADHLMDEAKDRELEERAES